jgi:hypothetical protein
MLPLSLIFWLTSAACTLIPKPNGTTDNNLSSRPLVRDPDPYEELDDSSIIPISELPIVIIKVRGEDVFFDRRTKKLLKPRGYFGTISKFGEGLAGASKNGKTGFINDRGEWVISPRFVGAMNLFSRSNHEYNRMYDLDVFNEGTTVIVVGEKYKFINKQGQVFTSGFDFVRGFDRGVAVVSVGGKYGLIDKQGEFIISPQSEQELDPYVGRGGILVELDGQERCIDNRGLTLLKNACQVIKLQKEQEVKNIYPQYKSKDSLVVGSDGAVYHNGKLLADRRWDEVVGGGGVRNVYLYRVGKKWGVVHGSGEIRTPPQFDNHDYKSYRYSFHRLFPNGLAKVSVNGKFGFVDEMGKLAIHPKFKNVGDFDFDPDLIPAESEDGKWGYVNRQGNFVIPPQFESSFNFDRRFSSLAKVKLKNKYGFIDRQGKLVVPARYDEIIDPNPFGSVGIDNYYDSLRKEKLTPARIGNKWGYINTQGTIQIPIAFDEAGAFKYGVAEVKIGSRTFYIDRSGKTLPF